MKRRAFLKTALLSLVAAYAPISLPEIPRRRRTNTMLTLDEIFKKVYGPRLAELPGPGMSLGKLSDIAFKKGYRVTLKMENGFTDAKA